MPEPKYIRAIYACAREHNVSREEIHDAIWVGWQKTSVKDLTTEEARRLLDGLRGRRHRAARRDAQANHGRKDYDHSRDAVQFASDADRDLVRRCAARRGWKEETLRTFTVRQIGKTEIRTMAELNKVLWPLKAMNRRDFQEEGL